GLRHDFLPRVVRPEPRLRELRVELHLVHGRHDTCRIDQRIDVLGLEVGDADRKRLATLSQLDHRLPALDVEPEAWQRPVDQVEVDLVEPQPLDALFERAQGRMVSMFGATELRGDEELAPREPGDPQRPAPRVSWGAAVSISR